MEKKISIIGCGWLGLPLGALLIEKGYSVKGSTTTSEKLDLLRSKGIDAYQLVLNPAIRCRNILELLDSEILIINIPPPKDRPDLINFHVQQIQSLLNEVKRSSIEKILFISSTSVYGNENKIVSEEDTPKPESNSGMALVKIEELFKFQVKIKNTIVRFGCLIGDERNPVEYMAGRDNIPNGDAPVNLIHLHDCMNIITTIIEKNIWNERFNAVADEHPSRAEYYKTMAERMNFSAPGFLPGKGNWKIVSNKKVKERLNYFFRSIY